MIKRLLMGAAMLSAVCSVSAQVFEVDPAAKAALPNVNNALKQPAKIDPASNQLWWGYYKGTEQRAAVGVKAAETYDQAIFISGSNSVVVGKQIKALRFYLRNTSATSNVKIWMSTTLPTDVTKADYVQDVDVSTLQGGDEANSQTDVRMGMVNDVALTTPYTVTDKGVYVGYTYTLASADDDATQYPVVTTYNAGDMANGLFIRSSASVTDWLDAYGQGLGYLAEQVLVEGTFANNAATPADFGEVVASVNGKTNHTVNISNSGKAGISDFDYTITTGGVTGAEQHLALDQKYDVFGGTTSVTIPFTGASEVSTKDLVMTITKVNGVANETTSNSSKGTLATVSKVAPRGVVVEEFTGTGCGWCPRGLVGMKVLREKFGDNFIGAAIHQYNSSDPMYLKNYASLGFSGAPSCMIDRNGSTIDPKYGATGDIRTDFANELAVLPKIALKVTGAWTDDATAIDITSTAEALTNTTDNFGVAYVLIADSLTGTTSAWKQANYYYQYTSSQVSDSELDFLCKGGEKGTSTFTWAFDDVIVGSSYTGTTNNATAFGTLALATPTTNTYRVFMPTIAKLKTVVATAGEKGKVAVIAMVLNPDGTVANAAKFYMPASTTGIKDVNANDDNATEVARYNAAGQQINGAQKGINIIKMSNGKTVKVIVNK